MLNGLATADFISYASKLPSVSPQRAWSLWEKFYYHRQTYREKVLAWNLEGPAFSQWRQTFFEYANSTIQTYWESQYGDHETHPTFQETHGNDVLPEDGEILAAGVTFIHSWLYPFRDQLDANWRDLYRAWALTLFVNAELIEVHIALIAWVIGGMYQIEIAIMLENAFCLDQRGRPNEGLLA